MNNNPDFVLCSSEGYNLVWPRNCWVEKKISSKTEGDFALIRVNPLVPYEDTKGNEILLDKIIVKSRHSDASLFSPNKWPIYIYVLIPKNVVFENEVDLKIIAWGELYASKESALRSITKAMVLNEGLDLNEYEWSKHVVLVKKVCQKILHAANVSDDEILCVQKLLEVFPQKKADKHLSYSLLFTKIKNNILNADKEIKKKDDYKEKVDHACRDILKFNFDEFQQELLRTRNL